MSFLKGYILSSQLEQFNKLSKISDWQEKAGPLKKPLSVCLNDQYKGGAFLEGRLFLANQNNLKCFQKALNGWIKAGP